MRFKTHLLAGVVMICSLSASSQGQSGCPDSAFENCASCVVVKNDSLRDCMGGLPAVEFGLQVYFNGNEEANVWLTSPCNGNIVGIQVLWASSGSTIPHLEDSITIYDNSGIYPDRSNTPLTHVGATSGPAILEAPQMNDGVLNEFANIFDPPEPLRVPVTAGQTFVVSFDFFTNICTNTCAPGCVPGAVCSGPTIAIDLDGCTAGRNGINDPGIDGCFAGMLGDFIIRAIIECSSADGACCLPDGTCIETSPQDCAFLQGEFQGAATDCEGAECTELVGACCTQGPALCSNTTQALCNLVSGTWLGSIENGFDCIAGDPCNLQGVGACCLSEVSCWFEQKTQSDCETIIGGTWQGLGTDCNANPSICTPTGACCFSTGGCLDDQTEANCLLAPGASWLGEGTICVGDGPPDSACLPSCPEDCATPKDGFVNVTDLLALLAGWGSTGDCDMAPPGGDGTVNVTDLLALLAAWGPCP